MLELLFRGFFEWIYGLILECWEYFSSVLFDLMSLDFAYLETYMPIITTIRQIMLGVGWALLLGNLVFQATRSMVAGIGFEADDPKLLFTRTFVFSFLLVASPQICDICLNMTSVIIDMVQMPDAAAIKLPDEGFFVDLTASWLLVIVFGLIVMFQTCKLFFEMAERYFILAVLTITAPLAFGVGGSRSTSDIFSGWCRMYGSMCLLMVMNVVFVKMLLSILSFRPSGIAVLPWIVMVLTVVKVAKKSDAIITRIGLNPAITGDSLGRSFPGVLTYTVARTMASRVVQTAGKNTAAGKTGAQTQTKSSSKPGSKPASGGRYYGGVNTVNTFADSRRSEQQSGSSPRQAEPRASGAEPTAQPASAATDRSFVMPGTRRPVSHVPGEQKIAPPIPQEKRAIPSAAAAMCRRVRSSIPLLPPSSIRRPLLLSADTAGIPAPPAPLWREKSRVRLPRLPMLRPRHHAPARYRRNGVPPALHRSQVSAVEFVPIPQE